MSTTVARLAAILAALALSLLLAAPALAHAELETSTPEAGATVTAPVTEVVLRFTEGLDAAKSSFRLVGPAGQVGTGEANRQGGRLMTLAGIDLEPGEYEVRWTAAATDGHIERGRFEFTVETAPASASPSTEPSEEPSAAPSDVPSEEPSAAPSSAPSSAPSAAPTAAPSASAAPSPSTPPDQVPASGTGTDVLLPIVAALLVVGVGGAYLLRRSRGA